MTEQRKRKLSLSKDGDLASNSLKKRKLLISSGDRELNQLKISGSITDLLKLQSLAVARFCSAESSPNSPTKVTVTWESQKLHSCLAESEIADQLLMHNIVSGTILTGKLWPIVLESSDDPAAQKRSLAFMNELANDWSIFQSLSEQDLLFLTVGIRDLWLAESRGLLSPKEKRLLDNMLDILDDESVPSAEHQSISFSFCPTKNRRILKFISFLEEKAEIDQVLLQTVAQLKIQLPGSNPDNASEPLYAVWVDARDLSYHNLEYILPLDRALHRGSASEKRDLQFKITEPHALHKTMRVAKCTLEGPDCDLLLQLDQLGLYQKPSNSSTRGGERFVFSSTALSAGLTNAIRGSDLLKTLFKRDDGSFSFVNYVFRCNRFAPGDAKFEMHLDTPYYDSEKNHISKYTMIIYLSSGSGDSILKVVDSRKRKKNKKQKKSVTVEEMKALECIIFDQQYEHEGRPFIDNNKIFLRTELVFTDPDLRHKPEISKLFSSAVYMTVESAFQPELARYAHDLYEQVNAVHWGLKQESGPPVVLHKCWAEQFHFASNGSDYWFLYAPSGPVSVHEKEDQDKSSKDQKNKMTVSSPDRFLKLAAMVAVLDYFNCHVKHAEELDVFSTFRNQCTSEKMISDEKTAKNNSDWILSHLWSAITKQTNAAKDFPANFFDIESKGKWFKSQLRTYSDSSSSASDSEDYNDDNCCPDHCGDDFIASKSSYVNGVYEEICSTSKKMLFGAPIVLVNKELHIDEGNIHISDDKIMIMNKEGLPPVNFASCWNGEPPRFYIGFETTLDAPKLLIPPITFTAIPGTEKDGSGAGFRLLMDFFKNDWLMPRKKQLKREILVPNMDGSEDYAWDKDENYNDDSLQSTSSSEVDDEQEKEVSSDED